MYDDCVFSCEESDYRIAWNWIAAFSHLVFDVACRVGGNDKFLFFSGRKLAFINDALELLRPEYSESYTEIQLFNIFQLGIVEELALKFVAVRQTHQPYSFSENSFPVF